MWSGPSGSSMAGGPSVGGTLAAPQISPAFGPMSSDYGMVQMNPRNQTESVPAQQLSQPTMRYQQYMQSQMPSPSFISSNPMQSTYSVDPAGVRPNSYVGPQCVSTSSYVGNASYDQAVYDSGNYRVVPQQMVMTSGSNAQMAYRCQPQFTNSQQMRSYGQQQMVQMHQRNAAVQQRQQQGLMDGPMYSGIPTATQRTPGMTHPVAPSQVRGMMMSGYNSGMMSSCGEFLRARPPGPISPVYSTAMNAYPQPNQSAMFRVGPSTMYPQAQSDIPQQHCVPYANVNYRVSSDVVGQTVSPYSVADNKIAVCQEIIEQPITLNHNSNSVEYIFIVPEDKFAQLQRGEIDVQLKGNFVDKSGDVTQYNIWPEASNRSRGNGVSCVSVFLNSTKIEIMDLRRSLYLGNYCQKATNKLVITSSKCVCSHYFSLQYIRWRPVQQVIGEIFKRRRMDVANSKKKVLKLIQMDINQSRIPLCWPKSQRIKIPVRSLNCKHTACFDLESFLLQNFEADTFLCPLCKVRFLWNDFEVDHFLAQILSESAKNHTASEARVDPSTGCWQITDSSMLVNAPQSQQRASTPYSKTPASVPQCMGNVASGRPLKRLSDNESANNPGGCPPSLKRIKSESFAGSSCVGNQRQEVSVQSSFNPGSVPTTSTSWVSSPVAPLSAVSPCAFSASPSAAQPGQQPQFNLSTVPSKYTAPDTPATPGSGNNSASLGPSVSPGGAQFQNVMHSQGSVETVSVAGSAPYTPASVSSLNNGNHCAVSASSITSNSDSNISSGSCFSSGVCNTSIGEITCSLNASALEDVFEELIYADAKTSSASEMEMYLRDEPLPLASSRVTSTEDDPPRSINDDQDWLDFAQVMANES